MPFSNGCALIGEYSVTARIQKIRTVQNIVIQRLLLKRIERLSAPRARFANNIVSACHQLLLVRFQATLGYGQETHSLAARHSISLRRQNVYVPDIAGWINLMSPGRLQPVLGPFVESAGSSGPQVRDLRGEVAVFEPGTSHPWWYHEPFDRVTKGRWLRLLDRSLRLLQRCLQRQHFLHGWCGNRRRLLIPRLFGDQTRCGLVLIYEWSKCC